MRKTNAIGDMLLVAVATFVAAKLANAAEFGSTSGPFGWPVATRTDHPWTRWWWLGSAVDKTNLTRELNEFRNAGIGGVEICPIYGAKGYEDRFIDFLSPKWMEMFAHTTAEANRLGLGVDLTTGTGWPFGGPNVTTADASAQVNMRRYELAGGSRFNGTFPKGRLQCLQAISQDGKRIDLTTKVKDGKLDWTAPPGHWKLYAMALDGPVQKVKRAAPGGVGNVLDPFSVSALTDYLSRFDKAFANYHGKMPRAFFQDSYEYYKADGTPAFFKDFKKLRGYDLRAELPALFGEGDPDTVARVKGDYRETLGDLHLAFIEHWTAWAHSHGSLTRNQAHGGPDNLLDGYAAADIPETEIFHEYNETMIPMMKLAPSAAHEKGRMLASSESFTWLGEHFNVPLSQVKPAADFLFLSGVNHIFFHGIPYSPADAPWPGWQFYASVNFGPEGGLWHDLPAFNAYVTRCQSILQSGRPSNDVLLYIPFHDKWQTASGDLLMTFETSGAWMNPEPFHDAAMTLWNRGYGFDETSDRLLQDARCRDGKIIMGGNTYQVLLFPKMRLLPEATLQKAMKLARAGATILVQGSLPDDVPGFSGLAKRRAALRKMLHEVEPASTAGRQVARVPVGKGVFLYSSDIDGLMNESGVKREPGVDAGLRFIRRTRAHGYHYFFVNNSQKSVDRWITLGTYAKSAVILDPRFADRAGLAMVRHTADGATQVYLQLHPDESCIVRTFDDDSPVGPEWPYFQSNGEPQRVLGTWKVQFIEGGPGLPMSYETSALSSWTTRDDPEARRFAGTARYTISFDRPTVNASNWILDLGRVCESARVKLNGRDVATLWCAPFEVAVGKYLKPGQNTLEIEVTNLAANRIRDLDRRHVNWKYFYDANVTPLNYRGVLDASNWPLRDSGLIGPVTLKPVKQLVLSPD